MFRKALWVLIVPIVLSACAAPPIRTPLAESNRSAIKTTQAHVAIVQDEVLVEVTPSTSSAGVGLAFGMIGALISTAIDSSVTNSRMKSTQALLEDFYPKIDDIDFRKMFKESMASRISDYPFKVTEIVTTPKTLSLDDVKQKLNSYSPGEALLIVYPSYRLSGDFKYIFGTAVTSLWQKGKDEFQYQGQVIYQSRAVGTGGADSLTQWGKDGGKEFNLLLKEAAEELVHLVLTDVNLDMNMRPEEVKTFPVDVVAIGIPRQAVGKVVSQNASRVRVIGKDGFHFSLPRATN
jgi:hypothetical protein